MRLNDSNRFKVLVHARMLALRECLIEQYRVERRVRRAHVIGVGIVEY